MLKFRGKYDEKPAYESKRSYTEGMQHLYAGGIPTVDEVNEVLAPMVADTILQILRGQAYSYGYDCKGHYDNDVPMIKAVRTVYRESPKQVETRLCKEMRREQIKTKGLSKAVIIVSRQRDISRDEAAKIVLSLM